MRFPSNNFLCLLSKTHAQLRLWTTWAFVLQVHHVIHEMSNLRWSKLERRSWLFAKNLQILGVVNVSLTLVYLNNRIWTWWWASERIYRHSMVLWKTRSPVERKTKQKKIDIWTQTHWRDDFARCVFLWNLLITWQIHWIKG